MDCDDIGSKIVTIAVITHGTVTNADVDPGVFTHVRLFSLAGRFQPSVMSYRTELTLLPALNGLFHKNLTMPTADIIDQYRTSVSEEYTKSISRVGDIDPDTVCRIYPNITVDKAFGASPSSIFTKALGCIFDDPEGIFLVSVHTKRAADSFTLDYPTRSDHVRNLNLMNMSHFRKFADIFGVAFPEYMFVSSDLPNKPEYISRQKSIAHDSLSMEERTHILTQQSREIAEVLPAWKLTISSDNNRIIAIRMSRLVQIIKHIVGPTCKMNLVDYSCSSVSHFFPASHRPELGYMREHDIESGIADRSRWGGRKNTVRKKKKSKVCRKRIRSGRRRSRRFPPKPLP